MRKLGQDYNICDFQRVLIYLIYKELLQVKGEHMNISIKRFAWEIRRQYKKRNIIVLLAYEKRLTITDNKGTRTQRERGIPALHIRVFFFLPSNMDNTQCCSWLGKLTLSRMDASRVPHSACWRADILRTLKMFILCDPGIQFLGIYPKEAIMNGKKKNYGQESSLQSS